MKSGQQVARCANPTNTGAIFAALSQLILQRRLAGSIGGQEGEFLSKSLPVWPASVQLAAKLGKEGLPEVVYQSSSYTAVSYIVST